MAGTHFAGPLYVGGVEVAGLATAASTFDVGTDLTVGDDATITGDLVVTGTTGLTGALTADAATITTGTVTTLTSTTGTISDLRLSVAAKTAGTTQTQAGATAITSAVTLGTTGNADDGYLLPTMVAGKVLIIHNLSANAGKVYANGTETLNGTAGNAGSTALTASKTMMVVGTGTGTSVSFVMM